METLTAQQAKQVIEYFAAQAAEDAPEHNADKHMWITRMQASIAIERQITELDWYVLLEAMTNQQSFDRDPGAYLHSVGIRDTETSRDYERAYLTDQVSWWIDNAYADAGE